MEHSARCIARAYTHTFLFFLSRKIGLPTRLSSWGFCDEMSVLLYHYTQSISNSEGRVHLSVASTDSVSHSLDLNGCALAVDPRLLTPAPPSDAPTSSAAGAAAAGGAAAGAFGCSTGK